MKMVLKRQPSNMACTLGEMQFGDLSFYTIEDVVRATKIPGMTAIPAGEYEVQITMSARFKKELPILLNVPGFSGVRIHSGNTAEDTEGCIIIGMGVGENRVTDSRKAMDALMPMLRAALDAGEKVTIEIKNA